MRNRYMIPEANSFVISQYRNNCIIDACRMITYLEQTRRNAIDAGLPAEIIELLNNVIAGWKSGNRVNALRTASQKEKELSLKFNDIIQENGFFELLYNIFDNNNNSLNGNDTKRVVAKKVISKLNRLNPLTVAARNAFRALVALNAFGLATIMSSENDKSKIVLEKTLKMYVNLGGKKEKLQKSIAKGKSKKPLFNKELKELYEKNKNNKIEGLGSVTFASLMASGAALVAKANSFAKKAGLTLGKKTKKNKEVFATPGKQGGSLIDDNMAPAKKPSSGNNNTPASNPLTAYEDKNTSDETEAEKQKKKKRRRNIVIAISSLGVIAIAAGGVYYYKKQKKADISKTKPYERKNINSKGNNIKKLEGIKLN